MAALDVRARGTQTRTARAAGLLLAALLLVCLVAGLASPSWATSLAAAATPDTSTPTSVRLVSMNPEVVRPGDTLTVRAEVTNTTTETLAQPVATLSVSKYRFITRERLTAWTDLTLSDAFGTVLESVEVPADLAPGDSAMVDFSVEADSMGLLTSLDGWGPRGMAVTLAGDGTTPASLDPVGALRTFVLWFPVEDTEVTPVDVSVLVPVVGPAVDPLDPAAAEASLTAAASTDGRLSKVLASTEDLADVGWAVDPSLVREQTPAGGGDASATTDTSSPGPSGRIVDGAADREVFALPADDQDVVALAAAGLPVPSSPPLSGDSATWRTDLSWPAEDAPDARTLSAVAAAGASTVVAAPGSLPPSATLSYTPSSRASVPTSSGEITALVPDGPLSAQLTSAQTGTAVSARQRMLAELAIVSRERPAEGRHLLLTAPRDWAPDASVARAQLESLGSTPWTRLRPVSTLIGAEDTDVARTAPAESAAPEGAITRDQLSTVDSAVADLRTFAQVVPDPASLVGPVEEAARAVTSVSWRADPAGRSTAVAGTVAEVDRIKASVSVVTAKNFNIISTGSQIPVQVVNDLDQPVTLRVSLDPDDPRLVAETTDPVTIGPGQEVREQVPVRAVGSGDVRVTAQVLALDGTVLGSAEPFEVRVRADWENMGTAVVAGLLVLLLGGGIWRTVHRGRSDRRVSADAVGLVEPADDAQHAEGHDR
ncbi:DUF6049 family protein [Sanguibacter inulinus]|uniref:Uncharacterized protein n=1 Tax=Sanguibacter inulinus TaxID=60922 RepID=A0A853EXM2_9MICO|nr:DUF6049 family protein [Sanguibacter inulinus]MBF0724391.1 hypothetical protein [Sanguibacter inulinus]NYS95536.1 hypothetical protein [Sanguibacter inulinus]